MTASLWVGQTEWIPRVHVADTPITRIRGLLARPPLPAGEGLLIRPCHAVHTCGMRYALDLIFFSHDWRICRVFYAVPPWRWWRGARAAVSVLEVRSGWIDRSLCVPGAAASFRRE